MFSEIQSSPGYSGPCKHTNLVINRKSGFRSLVRATKWRLKNVCNSLTRSEIMLMWRKVPWWLCFRGTVMKNVLQSLEYRGSSFWGNDTPFNPGNIWLFFSLNKCLAVKDNDRRHYLTIQPLLWRQQVFLESQKETSNEVECACFPILQFLPLYRRLS